MATGRDPAAKRLRFGLLGPAVLFSLLMFVGLGWHVFNTFQVGRELKDEYVRSEELRGRMCELHQRLVANALMVVASDDPRWEQRHRELTERLDNMIRDARDQERPGYNLGALWRAQQAHLALRGLEATAFAQARQGDKQAALALLSGPDYEHTQWAFSRFAADFVTNYRDQLNDRLRQERNKEVISLVIAFTIFAITLIVWIVLMRRVERRGRALAIEVAERQKAELALVQRETILAQAQEIAHLGSWETDLATGSEYWSDEFYRILGYAPGAFPPSQEKFFARIHPDDLPRLRAAMRDALESHAGYDVELRIRRPSGEERSVWVRSRIERSPDGSVLRAVGTLYDATEPKQIEERLQYSQQQLRSLAAHLEEVREQERALVARAIHDEMGQSLSAAKMDLFRLKRALPSGDEKSTALAEHVVELLDTSIMAVQRIMSELHPPMLEDLGLASTVEWQLEQFQQRTGIRYTYECPADGLASSPERDLTLFRILQESLNNVDQHAKATKVTVRLTQESDWMVLEVTDNGRGISAAEVESGNAFGLVGMRERVRMLGGQLEINGVAGQGTTVRARMPLLAHRGAQFTG